MLIMSKANDEQANWTLKPWSKSARTGRFARKPACLIVCYGRERDSGDLGDALAASPLEELEDKKEAEAANQLQLPAVLKTLVEGSTDDKLRLLLLIHKRLS